MKAALQRVLMAGVLTGLAATGPLTAQAKAIDGGTWAAAPNLLGGHVAHTATLLKDGRVLIAGGTDAHGVATAGCELFDPKANRWIRAGNMISARAAHAATLLADGNVLVTGGQTGLSIFPIQVLANAEIYHPATNSWTAVAPMHAPRRIDSSVRLRDGRVLVVGGTNVAPGSRQPGAELVHRLIETLTV
jgi:N-acetylneuraminic acid mutarotase